MICKTANISHSRNALLYAERGGELLYSNKCFGSADQIQKDFERLQLMNSRAEKKGIHAIISFNPEDRVLSDTDLIDIVQKYSEKQGFNENQFAVYLHEDKSHRHLHIIANRVGDNLKTCSSSNSYYKNLDFSKELETEYKLVETQRPGKGQEFEPSNERAKVIRKVLDICISDSDSLRDFCSKVEDFGIKVYKGRGISFTDQSGATFKGSSIGREYSLKGIEKQIFNNLNARSIASMSQNEYVESEISESSLGFDQNYDYSLMDSSSGYDEDIERLRRQGKKKKKRRYRGKIRGYRMGNF